MSYSLILTAKIINLCYGMRSKCQFLVRFILFSCMHVSECVHAHLCADAFGGQKKVLDPLEPELQAVEATDMGAENWTLALSKSKKCFNY